MSQPNETISAFDDWYSQLKGMKQYGGRPAKGTVAAALVVLERLRNECVLSIDAHLARGGAQLAGLNPSAVTKILRRYGESRRLTAEGGRTNRGNNAPIESLLSVLKIAGLTSLSSDERIALIDQMQRRLATSVDAYFRLKRIQFDFDASVTPQELIQRILLSAEAREQSGPVSQHLVGAKLEIRFPRKVVENFPFSAADEQIGRVGDFKVGSTAFHVTVAPSLEHARRCVENVRNGLCSYLLVPLAKLDKARVLIEELDVRETVAVEDIESFVGQNIGEIGEFDAASVMRSFGNLLRAYNDRVDRAESDKSLLIEIPVSLA